MHVTDRVIVDGLATIGWYHLPAEAQARIKDTLGRLAGIPPEQWERDNVKPWRPGENLFALRTHVGNDLLIVLFRSEGESIRVRHMVLEETLKRYFMATNGA